MGIYFITAIGLYLIIIACYLLWEQRIKRKWNASRSKGDNLFKASPKEDVIGKSHFILRHFEPEVTTLKISDKPTENAPIFAPGIAKEDSNPDSDLNQTTDDNSGEIDIIIDDVAPEGEFESNEEEGNIDLWESEEADVETSPRSQAEGLFFDELAIMVRTIEKEETATDEEREKAGWVLSEVRKTEIMERIAPDEKKKKVVSSLMDDYFAAYYRRQKEAQPTDAVMKVSESFDARSFA